jgi:hypothetical protein
MPEPILATKPRTSLRVDDWEPTRRTLHMWLQIVGKIRMINAPAINHWWHVTFVVSPRGLSTGPVADARGVFDLEFDFVNHRLVMRRGDGRTESMPLEGTSVAAFYHRVRELAERLEIDSHIVAVPNEVDPAVPFAQDLAPATYVPEHATAFWRQLVDAQRDLAVFRSGFRGKASPVHFFWGALDLAVTCFSGRPAPAHPGGIPNCPGDVMVESYSDELSSAGFWPGGGEEGAYYAYSYPEAPGYRETRVPAEAYYDPGLGEFVLPAERVRMARDPEALVQSFLTSTFESARSLAKW